MDFMELLVYTVNGVFSVVYRVIWSWFFMLIFISRLDTSLTPRGHEESDPGFYAYLGFLYVEVYYKHPVFVTAIALFARHCRNEEPGPVQACLDNMDEASVALRKKARTSMRARARWTLAYTLQRNASLRLERLHHLRWKQSMIPRPVREPEEREPASETLPLLDKVVRHINITEDEVGPGSL
jgi:hypothetical protein